MILFQILYEKSCLHWTFKVKMNTQRKCDYMKNDIFEKEKVTTTW